MPNPPGRIARSARRWRRRGSGRIIGYPENWVLGPPAGFGTGSRHVTSHRSTPGRLVVVQNQDAEFAIGREFRDTDSLAPRYPLRVLAGCVQPYIPLRA